MAARAVQVFVHDFPEIHLGIGLFGNTMFFVGSVCFLFPPLETLALWLFVVGSFGMLVGSLGQAFVRRERRRRVGAAPEQVHRGEERLRRH
jgi:hypothetical protein